MKHFLHLHLPHSTPAKATLAGLGAALAIALLALLADYAHIAMLMAPFGASCVLLFAAPAAPLSQPMNVVVGHVLSAAIGLGTGLLLPFGILAGAAAVGLAVAAMVIFRIVHPPAGATALVAVTATGWSFLVFPVLAGSAALVLVATLYHRLVGNAYPLRPVK